MFGITETTISLVKEAIELRIINVSVKRQQNKDGLALRPQ